MPATAAASCPLEPFHATPGGDAVLDCLTKQLTLRRNLVRDARKDAREDDHRPPDIPRLWILSAGRPETVSRSRSLGVVLFAWATAV